MSANTPALLDAVQKALDALRADLADTGQPITVTLDGATWSGFVWKAV